MCGNTHGKNACNLRQRTNAFALRIIRLCASLPASPTARLIGGQLLKSGTSPGAHYREACRARSPAGFVSKIEGGLQELEESSHWIELLVEGNIVPTRRLADLMKEADELTAILAKSAMTAKKNARR